MWLVKNLIVGWNDVICLRDVSVWSSCVTVFTLFFLASMGTDVAKNVLVSFILIMSKMIFAAPCLARPLLDFYSLLYVTHLRVMSL